MKTRDKILETALHLFNEKGTEKITVRHIAAEMGISHGNLCYHFKKKEDIIYQLYLRLVGEMNLHVERSTRTEFNFEFLYSSVLSCFETLYKYRFLLRDLVSITRTIPAIKEQFINLELQRREEFKIGINLMAHTGYFKKPVNEVQLNIFVRQLFMISNFWISDAEIFYQGQEKEIIKHYAVLAFNLVTPFLNAKGLTEMDSFLKKSLSFQ